MSAEAPERSGQHLSIGEVLAKLRSEFPDVTISKIRFLESQGLIDPERTPSGYRKFYPPDLERLRWILFQQRDHFLPLRVIKDRLDSHGPNGAPPLDAGATGNGESKEPTPVARPAPVAPPSTSPIERRLPEDVRSPDTDVRSPDTPPAPGAPSHREAADPRPAPPPAPQPIERPSPERVERPEPREPQERATPVSRIDASPRVDRDERDERKQEPDERWVPPALTAPPPPRIVPGSRSDVPERHAAPVRPPAPEMPFDDFVDPAEEDADALGPIRRSDAEPVSNDMTRAELLESTGLSDLQLDTLEEFGIVAPVVGEGERALYDDEALNVASTAAGFYKRGIEARHLKMYWHFAEREAALFAQVLIGYVRQRNPAARARLQEDLEDLARLGRRLRTAMLRRALGESLRE